MSYSINSKKYGFGVHIADSEWGASLEQYFKTWSNPFGIESKVGAIAIGFFRSLTFPLSEPLVVGSIYVINTIGKKNDRLISVYTSVNSTQNSNPFNSYSINDSTFNVSTTPFITREENPKEVEVYDLVTKKEGEKISINDKDYILVKVEGKIESNFCVKENNSKNYYKVERTKSNLDIFEYSKETKKFIKLKEMPKLDQLEFQPPKRPILKKTNKHSILITEISAEKTTTPPEYDAIIFLSQNGALGQQLQFYLKKSN